MELADSKHKMHTQGHPESLFGVWCVRMVEGNKDLLTLTAVSISFPFRKCWHGPSVPFCREARKCF